MTHLTYLIKDAYLVGDIGAKHFQFKAVSGGRAGSHPDHSNPRVANNPYLVGLAFDEAKGIAGGPLPCGKYLLRPDLHRRSKKHPNVIIKWIDLVPDAKTTMGPRTGGFAIHGHGERGSDGCIVPVHAEDLNSLYYAVLEHTKTKTGDIELSVIAGQLDNSVIA
jgi:hypothetical protein